MRYGDEFQPVSSRVVFDNPIVAAMRVLGGVTVDHHLVLRNE